MSLTSTQKTPTTQTGTTDPFDEAERLALAAHADPSRTPEYREATRLAKSLEAGGWRTPMNMNTLDRKRSENQCEKILRFLQKNDWITARSALLDLQVASLTRRICDLREMGYEFDKKTKVNPETGNPYVAYRLKGIRGIA